MTLLRVTLSDLHFNTFSVRLLRQKICYPRQTQSGA